MKLQSDHADMRRLGSDRVGRHTFVLSGIRDRQTLPYSGIIPNCLSLQRDMPTYAFNSVSSPSSGNHLFPFSPTDSTCVLFFRLGLSFYTRHFPRA